MPDFKKTYGNGVAMCAPCGPRLNSTFSKHADVLMSHQLSRCLINKFLAIALLQCIASNPCWDDFETWMLSDTGETKFHLCVCNVGDSLAYVYSGGQVSPITHTPSKDQIPSKDPISSIKLYPRIRHHPL